MLLWAHPDCEAALPASPAAAYDFLARLQPLDHHIQKQGRSSGRYRLGSGGTAVTVYLKKYPSLPWWQRWLAPTRALPGPREWENLKRVAALGVRTPEAVVVGADRRHPCASLFGTRELHGYTPLHEYIPVRFGGGPRECGRKRELITQLAAMAARLHAARLYHRDLYLCHFFVRESAAEPSLDVVLIDLTRLKHSRRRRWKVKDLAQLLFSSDLPGVTRSDRLRFFLAYLGIPRLDSSARTLLRQVLAKAERYRRHNLRLQAGKEA